MPTGGARRTFGYRSRNVIDIWGSAFPRSASRSPPSAGLATKFMAAKLLIFRSDGVDRVELTKHDVRIGRAPENDIVLQDQDKTVSRYHAELRHEQGSYVLIDVNSQNGIWVDGQRVQRTRLEPGRPVVLGKVRIELEDFVAGETRRAVGASAVHTEPVAEPADPAPVAALSASQASSSVPTVGAGVEGERSTRATQPPATAPTFASKVLKPKPMAVALGLVALAVVVLLMFRPSVPSSKPTESPEPILEALETTRMAGASALMRPETSLSAHGRTLPADTVVNAEEARLAGEAGRRQRIGQAKVALARDDYARAIEVLEGIPASDETEGLLEKARQLRAQRAAALMHDGARLEERGDLETANRRYMGARSVDPATPGLEEALTRLEGKMKVAGSDAYKQARQYDAFGRTAEAIPLYEKAVALLPLGDPNRAAARSRLVELKKGR
ncbi:MAG: FHA domain-containing protein [Luteitalea sp.]|nr:FHA domain-containing protein [Luteitalea sp.]